MSSYQAGVTPTEASARSQRTAPVSSSTGPSPAVLRTALSRPVAGAETRRAQATLAQYRPGTTQQVRPIPVPQQNVNRQYGNYGYGYGQGGYGGYYPNQQQLNIGATISKDGVSIALNKGPSYAGMPNVPGGIATMALVVEIPGYGRGHVRQGGIIPYNAYVVRDYRWYYPSDWFLQTVG